ncbi:MAG: D-amino-acid transaminase [Desulfobacteraceae bacterium]|nr:D-amino-acid transaminase [Desulfobacteraceae bacterium]
MIVYLNGRYIPKEEAMISPDDRGFLFADGVYEVIRSYGGNFFRLKDHLNRMERGLGELQIKVPDMKQFENIAQRLIQDNNLNSTDANVYIQVTRGAAPRKHVFPDPEVPPTIYGFASSFEPRTLEQGNGIKVILTPEIRWARCDIKSVALPANVLANQRAKENNAAEAIFVREGVITEGSHTNFCAVFDGRLVTYPENNYILPGITRKAVLELCRKLNIPYREFPVYEKDLKNADECMVLGTTAEVMPVVQVDDRIVGDGRPGPVTIRLQKAFNELV